MTMSSRWKENFSLSNQLLNQSLIHSCLLNFQCDANWWLERKVLLINFIESAILRVNFVIYEFSLEQIQLIWSMHIAKGLSELHSHVINSLLSNYCDG